MFNFKFNIYSNSFICLFFLLEDKYDKVKNISKKIVITGFGGTTGNKGSCVINFDYENTNISVACSHLVTNIKNV